MNSSHTDFLGYGEGESKLPGVTLHGPGGVSFSLDGGVAWVIRGIEPTGHLRATTEVFVDGVGPYLCRETVGEILELLREVRGGMN